MSIQIPRGTQDILPGTVELWQYIEGQTRNLPSLQLQRNSYTNF